MDPVIRVENLGKSYRIGVVDLSGATTRRQSIAKFLKRPAKHLQSLVRPPSEEETLWALRDVSFEVKQGEVLGIIGRNGAGKSTLLKILSRLTDPTEGSAILHGRVGSLLEVGTGFHRELTGRENIYLSGTILGMRKSEIDRKLDEIVEFSEIGRFLDTPVKRYSSGMNVRLGFAVAAHLEPEILIVDEVLAVGDLAFQRKCLGKMENVAGEGRTILFVSHSMSTIQTLCERLILLENGTITRSGAPAVVIHEYEKKFLPEADGDIDLTDHPNRVTDKQLLKRLRILNGSDTVTTHFRIGDKITFEITLDVGDEDLTSPYLYFSINRHGAILANLTTHLMVKDVFRLHGRIVARVVWDPGWLSPGTYFVNRVGIKRYSGGERVDHIENIAQFEMIESDMYGTAHRHKEDCLLVPKGYWEFWTSGTPDSSPPQFRSQLPAVASE